MTHRISPWLLGTYFFFTLSTTHTKGEEGDTFPKIYNSERDTNAQPMNAEEAVATMILPPGFRASVFATEPDVQNPIGMAWDRKGRLWIAENYTYAERSQRFDLTLRDRVLMLEDLDGDGRMDKRTVFNDQVQILTSVEVGKGGVWLMCPPRVLFIPDADEDGIADGNPQVVLDGFKVGEDNHHNFANGLKFGPDGWLYGRCGHSSPGLIGVPGTPDEDRLPLEGGVWRYSPETRVVEVLCHGTTNPWGHDWDANGELFFTNTVIGHLWHVMPGSHFKEPFGESMNPHVYERLDMIADHYHFDTTGTWQESRDGKANSLGGGHAHVGATICLDPRWPENYIGRLFTINMHGMRANVEKLERLGAGYVGLHEPDFFISSDPFFRAIELSFGPDGAMYVFDWSDSGECHEATGVHRTSGRIYRIEPTEPRAISAITDGDFPKPACMAGSGRLPELWRRYQAGTLGRDEMVQLLQDPDEHLRVWGIRFLTDRWPLDSIMGPSPKAVYPEEVATIFPLFVQLAEHETSGLVISTLASTLQRLPVANRVELATPLLKKAEFANDRHLPLLTWYGLVPVLSTSPDSLSPLFPQTRWSSLQRSLTRGIAEKIDQAPGALDRLLKETANLSLESIDLVLGAMYDAFKGRRALKKPTEWEAFVARVQSAEREVKLRELSGIFGEGRPSAELLAIVRDGKAEMKARQQALLSLIDVEEKGLRNLCISLLDTRILNVTAMTGLAKFDEREVGLQVARRYRRFLPEDRGKVIEMLVSRKSFANALLDVLESPQSPFTREDIQPFHARQVISLDDPELSERFQRIWGNLRETPEEKRGRIESIREKLTADELAKADLSRGRGLFEKNCSQCHKMYGAGAQVGPDLTGSQRGNLDYLLENIIDPSAIVGKDYRMSLIRTEDDRTLSGLIVSRNDSVLVLQTPTAQETIPVKEIDEIKTTALSSMPDGLLDNLTWEQTRDLLGYLMHPTQVAP